jgi:hypothetical protein
LLLRQPEDIDMTDEKDPVPMTDRILTAAGFTQHLHEESEREDLWLRLQLVLHPKSRARAVCDKAKQKAGGDHREYVDLVKAAIDAAARGEKA